MAPTTKIVKLDNSQVEKVAAMFAGLTEMDVPEVDAAAVTQSIIEQMLSAETEEEMWAELPTVSTKDAVGRSFEILGGNIYASKFTGQDGRKGAFLACRAVDLDTGEQVILNTSAARIAGRILWYVYRAPGATPRLRIVKKGESTQGYAILDAERV